MTGETTFTLPAYAKINWSLRVLGRRGDGWHELETVFQTVDLADRLTFTATPGEGIELGSNAPPEEVPRDESNLVYRAARALREKCAVRFGARIHLEKNIPVGGGLGGGSSDACAALLGLAHLWRLNMTRGELLELGARLGADVPFFFTGGTALGVGTGTEIHPLTDATDGRLLIVTPDAKVLTAEAYRALRAPALTKPNEDIKLTVSRAEASLRDFRLCGSANDFETAIFALRPEIKRAREALVTHGAEWSLMSGSGASVFGVFDNQQSQENARLALSGEQGWRVTPCATLTRAQYRRSFGDSARPLYS
jgi:4-diphosphocytidyl-2-C-methyl-D-erythritol kinase